MEWLEKLINDYKEERDSEIQQKKTDSEEREKKIDELRSYKLLHKKYNQESLKGISRGSHYLTQFSRDCSDMHGYERYSPSYHWVILKITFWIVCE